MFLDSRDKSINMLKFCRNNKKKNKNEQKKKKVSVLVAESAYNLQNAQFRLIFVVEKACVFKWS